MTLSKTTGSLQSRPLSGTFTYADTGLASAFSSWLEDELGAAVSKSGKLRLFNRAAAAMDSSFKLVYGDFFASTGVDALLVGRFSVEGGVVRVRLELTGLSDGILIGVSEMSVPMKSIPSGMEIKPSAMV